MVTTQHVVLPLQQIARVAALLLVATTPTAQAQSDALLQAAHMQVTASHLDSADALFRVVIDTATPASNAERATALLWHGIIAFMRGSDSLTRAAFRAAFAWSPSLKANGLAPISPHLQEIFDQEQSAAPQMVVHLNNMDPEPYRLGGPPVRYPLALLRRSVHGQVRVSVILDTLGHIEPGSVQVYDPPDSALIGPLRDMALASQYVTGRVNRKPVRAMLDMIIDMHPPPPPTATALATDARTAIARHHADSALALLGDALDTATHATEGERMYVLVVRSMARAAADRDSAARADLDSAFALKRDLTAKHGIGGGGSERGRDGSRHGNQSGGEPQPGAQPRGAARGTGIPLPGGAPRRPGCGGDHPAADYLRPVLTASGAGSRLTPWYDV